MSTVAFALSSAAPFVASARIEACGENLTDDRALSFSGLPLGLPYSGSGGASLPCGGLETVSLPNLGGSDAVRADARADPRADPRTETRAEARADSCGWLPSSTSLVESGPALTPVPAT